VAHVHNLMGTYTNMNIILKSNLHFRTLQLKLTPNLNNLVEPMKDELNFAIQKEIPDCTGEHHNTFARVSADTSMMLA